MQTLSHAVAPSNGNAIGSELARHYARSSAIGRDFARHYLNVISQPSAIVFASGGRGFADPSTRRFWPITFPARPAPYRRPVPAGSLLAQRPSQARWSVVCNCQGACPVWCIQASVQARRAAGAAA